MDMALAFPEQALFFNTGQRPSPGLDPIDGLELRPAAFAPYRDLRRLRYDFPVLLVTEGDWAGTIRSLSTVIDELLAEVAPRGPAGERLRRHVLRLEREIRALTQAGERGRLSALWTVAIAKLPFGDDPSAQEVLAHVGDKLKLDGELVDCDAAMPARVCEHLWSTAQRRKAESFRASVERLIVRLSDILRAAYIHSEAGRRPVALRAAFGGTHRDAFDFDVMSKLVARNAPKDELSPTRRARIERVLAVLRSQRFVVDPGRDQLGTDAGFGFRFDDCAAAAQAYRSRLREMLEVVKAIAIAELESDSRYVERQHDEFFQRFDAGSLSAADLALFPDYLVCIPPGRNDAGENAALMDVLSAGLPVKVLVEATDLLEESSDAAGHFAFGVRSTRLANTATGLGGVFVIQAPGSHLYALRERIERAFAHPGAGLISVYPGPRLSAAALPAYLIAAAAMESRAFPAFTYDPYAGDNQAARFSLEDNPQPEADWPVATLHFADEDQQRSSSETAFTIADFVLCDPAYTGHFARVPRERWNPSLVPADEWLASDSRGQAERLPCLMAVDADDVLQRVIVDARLMKMVARCRTFWHRLQEQGGIHNSHAQILLAREKAKWDAQRAEEAEQKAQTPAAAARSAAKEILPEAPGPSSSDEASRSRQASSAPDPDQAWIETARCPSCNECQTVNDRMFKYNENKQAYIADVSAGTYRELVEAAEACQVAIIHPGKPRNPDEPGLADLVERAKPFL